ncbi:hypothetical protein BY996DRAFT_7138858 [Phakopsora pachyrhizi]|nr:hypothetical protein BY996DRAFT_7138858 [Phakopsora pachyrhizi]
MDPRSINFNVLRRHDPQINSIIDSTSYAVIYRYFHGAWSKTGFEGTMFIFRRGTPPLHGVFVLNRQSLENLCEGLLPGWDVDLDEGLIIWRSAGATGDADDDVIYGIWVYEEKDRIRISSTMQSLIDSATISHKESKHENTSDQPQISLSHPVPRVPIISAGQSISLDQLFGVNAASSEPPPPPVSSLPHPGVSISSDSDQQNGLTNLPTNVMSPDPSDLPKGVHLIDSLFQKAGIKSQVTLPDKQHQSPELVSQTLSIHQLMQATLTPPQLTSQSSPSKPPTKQSVTNRRERRRDSSSEVSLRHQTYADGSLNPANRAPNQHYQPSLPESKPNSICNIQQHESRRSSAGSSSNSRLDRAPHTKNNPGIGNPHQKPMQGYPSESPTYLPAVAPVEASDAADARKSILSLLGHPAAKKTDNIQPSTKNGRFRGSNTATFGEDDGGSPVSFGSACIDEQGLYPGKLMSENAHGKTSSQKGSQHASPRIHPSTSAGAQHPSQQLGNRAFEKSSVGSGDDSSNGSPRGPRQQNQGHYNQQEGGFSKAQYSGSGGQYSGSGPLGNAAWNFQNTPLRALSPLNPASQQPKLVMNEPKLQSNNYQNRIHSKHSSTPPQVNDSSRPSRSHSYGSSNQTSGSGVVNAKLAADTMDELLSETKMSKGEDGEDESPLNKKAFVMAINELMKNNGAFVDTLYARYLARYAAKYL